MNKTKLLIVGIAFGIAGCAFIVAGLYFFSERFLGNLKVRQRKLGRASGLFAISVGILTIVCGILFIVVPAIKDGLALFYIAVLFISFCVLAAGIKRDEKR